jgi:hypothetical protein
MKSLGYWLSYIDDVPKIKDSVGRNLSDKFPYQFSVGENEKHQVQIILTRILNGWNPPDYDCEVFVDGDFFMRW